MHYIYIYISHATKSERCTHEHNETEDNNYELLKTRKEEEESREILEYR